MKDIVIQLIGFVWTVFILSAFQAKKRSSILLIQLIGAICFMLHFFLLDALSGSIMNGLVAVRSLVFYFRGKKKWADSVVWLPVFIILGVAAIVVTWNGWLSLLPLIGLISTTFAQFSQKPMVVRLLTLPNCPCWLVYNSFAGSISGVITEILIAISIIVGFLRHDVKKKAKE